MERFTRFNVVLSEEVYAFLNGLKPAVKNKIISNIRMATQVLDPKLFKKLDRSEIWEFRTLYEGIHYRILAFWDKTDTSATLVFTTHGFVKKTSKIPRKEIERAQRIMSQYFQSKKG